MHMSTREMPTNSCAFLPHIPFSCCLRLEYYKPILRLNNIITGCDHHRSESQLSPFPLNDDPSLTHILSIPSELKRSAAAAFIETKPYCRIRMRRRGIQLVSLEPAGGGASIPGSGHQWIDDR